MECSSLCCMLKPFQAGGDLMRWWPAVPRQTAICFLSGRYDTRIEFLMTKQLAKRTDLHSNPVNCELICRSEQRIFTF